MDPAEVKQLIERGIPGAEVTVTGDGSHFSVTVVSSVFEGLSLLNKQRTVLATINDQITRGEIHAVDTIKSYTPDEWKRASKLLVS